MFLAALILILSTALFFFYFQATCQKILRRQFDREYYFQVVVDANRLEFPSVRKALEEFDAPVEYQRFRMMLKCDFLALTYLLKNAGNVSRRYSRQERFLMLYFRLTLFSMFTRHLLGLQEKPAVLKLTTILRYFANVVGERVNSLRFGNLAASDYLLNL